MVLCIVPWSIHLVSIADESGHLLQSYGGTPGVDSNQLKWPCYIALNNDGLIYVADYNNGTVLLLSPTLEYVRHIITCGVLPLTAKLYLDVRGNQLHIGQDEGQVSIVELESKW